MNIHIQEILCTPAQLRHVLDRTEVFLEIGFLSMVSPTWGYSNSQVFHGRMLQCFQNGVDVCLIGLILVWYFSSSRTKLSCLITSTSENTNLYLWQSSSSFSLQTSSFGQAMFPSKLRYCSEGTTSAKWSKRLSNSVMCQRYWVKDSMTLMKKAFSVASLLI